MKLTIFDRKNCGTTTVRTGVRSVNISRKNGGIMFSQTLRKQLGIKVEQTVCFAKDEDSKTGDWYVCFNGGEYGLTLREKKSGGFAKDSERTLYFCNKFIANKLLDASKAQQSATFLIAKSPLKLRGKNGSR